MIKNEYAQKKAKAEAIAFENLQSALKNSAFAELHKKERSLIFDIAYAKSIKKPTTELSQALNKVKEEKFKTLSSMNINETDLQPSYECKICNDSGVASGKMCKCFEKRVKERLIAESSNNIQSLHSFKEFNEKITMDSKHQEQLNKLKTFLCSWIDSKTDTKPKLICLSGKTGVGKTFLTECTATYALKNGLLVSLISAFGMNNLFLRYHTSKADEKVSVLDSLMDPDLLVIDDLGTEPILNNVTIEYLYLIISERLLQNKFTLITTNLNGEGILTRYGERIFSRIFNKRQCKSFQIIGSDLRINK